MRLPMADVDLRGLAPSGFQSAVLERESPDMAPEEVIRLAATWKGRLGTRFVGLARADQGLSHPEVFARSVPH